MGTTNSTKLMDAYHGKLNITRTGEKIIHSKEDSAFERFCKWFWGI